MLSWYKLFRSANEDSPRWWETKENIGTLDYLDIGHDQFNGKDKNANDVIWYYNDKEIVTMDAKTRKAEGWDPREMTHAGVFGYEKMKSVYKGRYDAIKKLISMSRPPPPYINKYLDMQNFEHFLDNMLLAKFGNQNRIIHW